jgi:hypothetical protein
MSYAFSGLKHAALKGGIDFENDDIRVLLVMESSSLLNYDNSYSETIAEIPVLDEADGSGYARVALTGKVVRVDTYDQSPTDEGNRIATFTCNDVVFPLLGPGTTDYYGMLVYKHVSGDGDSIPLAFLDDPFPVTGTGDNLTFDVLQYDDDEVDHDPEFGRPQFGLIQVFDET